MNLQVLELRAACVLITAILVMVFLALVLGGGAFALILLVGVIGGIALLVLLLAIVADATVQTLNKEKK